MSHFGLRLELRVPRVPYSGRLFLRLVSRATLEFPPWKTTVRLTAQLQYEISGFLGYRRVCREGPGWPVLAGVHTAPSDVAAGGDSLHVRGVHNLPFWPGCCSALGWF